MQEALAWAQRAIGLSEPNPRVGCVIVDAAGRPVGRGHTQAAGGPHAEVMALRDAAHQGADLSGATAYVTLEPCSHHGRTPPCCDALLAANIARVVAATRDPNPLVSGRGLAQLRAGGVVVHEGLLDLESIELNIGFFSRMQRQRPWVRLKSALSLDGHTALENGLSLWITGPAAQADGHLWRKRAAAILTGVGTVLSDNPRLDVRWVETAAQPMRIIIDSKLRTPPTAQILDLPGAVIIYTAVTDVPKTQALTARKARVVCKPNAHGKVDLPAVLADLASLGVNELHIEAGHRLSGAFVHAGLVDEYLTYLAPKLLGSGLAMASFGPVTRLEDSVNLSFHSITVVGDDLRVLARPRSAPPA